VLPIASLLTAALAVACLVPVASLLTTGEVFGVGLPFDMPPWVAILGLAGAYALVTAPLRALRHATYESLGPRRRAFEFWDGVLRIAFVVLALWVATRFLPGVDDMFRSLFQDWRETGSRVGEMIALVPLP
jgi:hypothetical protein